ncbi:MAG: hypothetical protein Ct9H300mP21_10410 [Pseudomonadota bacterium]|nr:MAG: hypothetical protein Ct9H300mP21_10410 [Pseudomonadota bacterium]
MEIFPAGSNNQYVSLEDFQGKVVLMFFGFTACPDTCPLTLSKLKQVMANWSEETRAAAVYNG